MEAVPRLPMLGFKLKQSADPPTSFNNLKLYIAEQYQEDADSYSKEVHDLETLRNIACRPSRDMDGCLKMKRYYCQLNSLLHRFPLLAERPLLTFSWRDTYSSNVVTVSDIRSEMAVILYNIAALHAQLGTEEDRVSPESMKVACTHFQCAAGALEMFKEHGAPPEMSDLNSDVIMFMNRLCLAEAQECILEKSLSDNRKPGIVAKVTSQIVNYYNAALAMIIASGDDGPLADVVGSKQFKEGKKYLTFKISYLSAILYMYQGQSAEEAKRFGERVTLCQLAWDKFEEAKKEASKGMPGAEQVQKALVVAGEILEAKRKAAKNENEFIYHEEVPDISSISAVQGANLVNGITFSVTDSELLGKDIFHRLVPMRAHEGSSVYSEEKAQLLRTIGTKIEDRDAELNAFMNSLNMEFLQFDQTTATKLPQAIVDRCASLNARPNAIPDLVALMSQLAENCGEVEMLLREIKQIFAEEEVHEKAYQQAMGQRPTVHLGELNREYQKYQEAHNKAGESNETLRKAMGLHVANLRILSKPMMEIQSLVPHIGKEQVESGGGGKPGDNPHFGELRKLLNKVTEMRGQRTQFVNTLRDAINSDDITSKIVAWGDNDIQALFKQEMVKHEKTANLIDMNLVAQGNILKALTDCYAKCATAIKQMSDTKHKRDQFFSGLVASYDVYEDLLGKSTKGLEFYKKLHNNVAKLLTRVKAARDVQSEERQQRLNSTAKSMMTTAVGGGGGGSLDNKQTVSSGPKLRDYMKAGGFVPAIRPSPLGSENTTASTCVTATTTDKFNSQTMMMMTGTTTGVGAMQYGGGAESGNNYNQLQNYSASGATSTTGNYYPPAGNTTTGYGSQQMNTGYVNPIYQTGSYGGEQQQQQQQSYNYPAMSSSGNTPTVPVTTSGGNVSTGSGRVSHVGGAAGGGSATSGYSNNTNSGYNNQQYSTASQVYNPTSSYGNTYPMATASATSNSNTPSQSGYSTGHQSQQQQQVYQDATVYPTTSNSGTSHTMMNYSPQQQPQQQYSNQSYSASPATAAYGTQSSAATGAQQQYIGQSYPSGYGNQSQSQNANQYSSSTSSVATTMSNIPQVNQQMSQMNISGTSEGGAYATYYAGQPQQYTNVPTTMSQQTYYGQQTGGGGGTGTAMQYPQQQQQYGASDTMSGAGGGGQQLPQANSQQYGTNNQSYGYANQYGANWNNGGNQQQIQTGQVSQQGVQSNYAVTGSTYNPGAITASQGYVVNQSSVAPQPVPQNTQVYSNQSPVPSDHSASGQVVQPSSQVPATVAPVAPPVVTPAAPVINPTPVPAAVVNSKNMDLLSGIDFVPPAASLPEPMLQPKPAPSSVASAGNSVVGEKEAEEPKKADEKKSTNYDDVVSSLMDDSQPPPSLAKMDQINSFLMSAQQQSQSPSPVSLGITMDRKMSMDNLSVCSEISSIDQNFDWESVSVRNDSTNEQSEAIMSKFRADGGSDDPKVVKWFHSEVERLEKFLEGVNIKTLNGSTPLDKKWQELQNLLAKEAGKRTTSVAKLFPEKNRSPDCIPYDHARVQLPTATDDYVNACYVKDLGSSCPPLILAQTPMQNTNKDFWHMVWSQKSKLIVCLHTPAEMVHPFWPTKVNEEMHFDDFSVVLLKQFDLTNCVEYNLKLSMSGTDAIHELSALQLKTWAQKVPSQVVGVARDIITSYEQRVMSESGSGTVAAASTIVINCLTGSKRSPLVAVTVAAVLAAKSKRPLLINVVDAWFRIAAQRRGVLENEKELEYSFQVMLSNAHDLLNKHGIMTPYQVKNAQKAAIIEKEQIKDPLSELDPLWKLKK